jgi:hypothetical protein
MRAAALGCIVSPLTHWAAALSTRHLLALCCNQPLQAEAATCTSSIQGCALTTRAAARAACGPCTAFTSAGALAPAPLRSTQLVGLPHTSRPMDSPHLCAERTSTRSTISSQLVAWLPLHLVMACPSCEGQAGCQLDHSSTEAARIQAVQALTRYRCCTAVCTGWLQLLSCAAFAAVLHTGQGSSLWLLTYCRNCERVTCGATACCICHPGCSGACPGVHTH